MKPPFRYQEATPRRVRGRPPRQVKQTFPTRGVVMAVHFADETEGGELPSAAYHHPAQVTCDVLTWWGGAIYDVPVMQRGSSVGDAELWTPRPATRTLDGSPLVWEQTPEDAPADPENTDGEWVVVAFFDGDPSAPYIEGSIPHPRTRRAHGGAQAREAFDPTADGSMPITPHGHERYTAHAGSVLRVDASGNVRLDTRQAGEDQTGEGAPSGGHVDVDLRSGAWVTLRYDGGRQVRLRLDGDGTPQLDIFAGDRPLARLSDYIEINATTSPLWAAFIAAVVAAHQTVIPPLQAAANAQGTTVDALAAWAATPAPPNNGRPPFVAPDVGEVLPVPPPAAGPFPAPYDQTPGGAPPAGFQAVGQVVTASSQIRGT